MPVQRPFGSVTFPGRTSKSSLIGLGALLLRVLIFQYIRNFPSPAPLQLAESHIRMRGACIKLQVLRGLAQVKIVVAVGSFTHLCMFEVRQFFALTVSPVVL